MAANFVNGVDMISLPMETIDQILSHLSCKELVNLGKTCTFFRRILYDSDYHWRNVEKIQFNIETQDPKDVLVGIQRCSGLSTVTIRNMTVKDTNTILTGLGKLGSQLTHLELYNCGVPLDMILQLSLLTPRLEVLKFFYVHDGDDDEDDDDDDDDERSVDDTAEHEGSVDDTAEHEGSGDDLAEHEGSGDDPSDEGGEVNGDDNDDDSDNSDEGSIEHCSHGFANLQCMYYMYSLWSIEKLLILLGRSCNLSHLKLDLNDMYYGMHADLLQLFRTWPNMKVLFLFRSSNFKLAHFRIGKHFPKLEDLTIEGMFLTDSVELLAISAKCKQLKKITLKNCKMDTGIRTQIEKLDCSFPIEFSA